MLREEDEELKKRYSQINASIKKDEGEPENSLDNEFDFFMQRDSSEEERLSQGSLLNIKKLDQEDAN